MILFCHDKTWERGRKREKKRDRDRQREIHVCMTYVCMYYVSMYVMFVWTIEVWMHACMIVIYVCNIYLYGCLYGCR